MALTIRQHPNVCFSSLGDVIFVLWTGEPTVAANRWLIGELLAAFMPPEQTFIILVFLAPTVPIPSAEARKQVQEAFRTRLGPVRRLVNVPLGDSVKQNLLRTVLRAVAMLGDTRKVVVIGGNADEAIALARAEALPATPSGPALRAAIHELFAAARLSL